MKKDSLNRLDESPLDNLSKKYGYAFDVVNVPQKVSFNEGIESAKKFFCSNPLIDCDSIPGKTEQRKLSGNLTELSCLSISLNMLIQLI